MPPKPASRHYGKICIPTQNHTGCQKCRNATNRKSYHGYERSRGEILDLDPMLLLQESDTLSFSTVSCSVTSSLGLDTIVLWGREGVVSILPHPTPPSSSFPFYFTLKNVSLSLSLPHPIVRYVLFIYSQNKTKKNIWETVVIQLVPRQN